MRKLSVVAFMAFALTACGSDSRDGNTTPAPTPIPTPQLSSDQCYLMSTSLGDITLAIDTVNTPVTGKNFARYVEANFYDGTLFHRVIHNFMIQGGGFTSGLIGKPGFEPIVNEASVGFTNERGTIAMARTSAPNSATSQFFINTLDNPHLDQSANSYGYAVFGKVIEGMEVVDQISIVATTNQNGHSDVPVNEVVIESVASIQCASL
ncbi:peptidylprolyl isomerase [Shewanella psychrotolerans]|uniref:peptidylprolyl isomerase n=1 Tax=Shewanella psychrotolerans TaxID=2864206 RepID=UPI001C65BCD7|nr:peptidylprolyl isomerase [Shewanella psychrotolerans]QYK02116.1 peptidylprolyl isomerase [Shewanella psychrotolerans]